MGELADPKQAMLPIIAAVGGMVVPVLIYIGINPEGHTLDGWGVPMATDIAFALGGALDSDVEEWCACNPGGHLSGLHHPHAPEV
ncbi:MAG: Na+/H+ antiporter NhaA [Gammaproteobacteria bacterium]|nr:Na+/H+ antiporter NhaA [Gammaproteobacteria bacterium]